LIRFRSRSGGKTAIVVLEGGLGAGFAKICAHQAKEPFVVRLVHPGLVEIEEVDVSGDMKN
jgi:hypothetical protein